MKNRLLFVLFAVSALAAVSCSTPAEIAEYCLQNNEFEKAALVCSNAIGETGASDPWLYANRAQAYWRLNRLTDAENDLKKAKELGLPAYVAHMLSAQMAMFVCDYDAAEKEAAEAEKLKPASPLPRTMKNSAAVRGSMVKKSFQSLSEQFEKEKDIHAKAILAAKLAKLEYYNLNRPADAVARLEKALAAMPGEFAVSDALAWFRATSWDPKLRDAKKAYALALANAASKTADPVALDTLAAAAAATGNFPEAVARLENAVKNIPALPPKRQDFFPYLKLDFSAKLQLFQSRAAYVERRGSVRLLWIVTD